MAIIKLSVIIQRRFFCFTGAVTFNIYEVLPTRTLKFNADTDPFHKERSRKRTKSDLECTRGREYCWGVLVGAISAIPRWMFARSLESRTFDEGASMDVKAKKSYFLARQEVVLGWANSRNFLPTVATY